MKAVRGLRAILGAIAILALPSLLIAQNPVVTRTKHRVTCATCRVEFTTIAVLGKSSDPVSITPIGFRIVQDSRGRFFTFSDEMQLLVYDSKGNFVQAVGRKGDGPGEFSPHFMGAPPPLAIGPGDTVVVFDQSRITVFSPELRYVRTVQPRSMFVSAGDPLPNGNWMLHGEFRSAQGIGYSAHIMNAAGTVTKSIGPQDTLRPGVATRPRSFLQAPDRNTFWFNDARAFWLQQWSVQGSLLTSIEISDAPYMSSTYGGAVNIIGIDAQGRIWIEGIERGPPPPARGTQPSPRSATRQPPVRTLEILDPRTGSVVVSQRMDSDFGLRLFPSGALAYTMKEDSNGLQTYHILSFLIVGR